MGSTQQPGKYPVVRNMPAEKLLNQRVVSIRPILDLASK
ncbi:hypothetical protein PCH70_40120 [Pseudomonas cichorii JBC1]|nr:hypothetical protein PCH70_40120 [Pseudomonas cichorii JBC1]